MTINLDFHARASDRVSATGCGSTTIAITAYRGDIGDQTAFRLFIPLAQARDVHSQLTRALAEIDLIAKAKADAVAHSEAA